jgi:hypothetical protein
MIDPAAMAYRQAIVDAMFMELKSQLGGHDVSQTGTEVNIEGVVKMARVAEAVIREAFSDDDEALVKSVLNMYPPKPGREREAPSEATDLLWNLRRIMLGRLDPLP